MDLLIFHGDLSGGDIAGSICAPESGPPVEAGRSGFSGAAQPIYLSRAPAGPVWALPIIYVATKEK